MNTMRFFTLQLTITFALLFWSAGAHAYSNYRYTVPNGDRFGCALCHIANVPPDGAPDFLLNRFGEDYRRTAIPAGSTQNPKWTRSLAEIDSDMDGYTNGEELQEITGDPFVWEPRKIGGGDTDWVLTAGVPSLTRNPGDGDQSIPGVRFNTIRPTSYTLNVGDRLDFTASGQTTVPGRDLAFEIVGRGAEIEGLQIGVDSRTEDQGLQEATARITWTPAEQQGGNHTIGIQITDGTDIKVQTVRVTVEGGINEPDPGGEPAIPDPVKISDFTSANFDFDNSLRVDLADFTIFASRFGQPAFLAGQYDFDKSGRVDWQDLLFFAYFFHRRINTDINYRTPAGDQLAYVPIKGGSFVQEIDGSFQQIFILDHEIGKHEITNRQYRNYLQRNNNLLELTPSAYNGRNFETRAAEIPEHPVVGVSWEMADKYCKWADARLPTQTEWVYAARGLEQRPYAHGQTLAPSQANYQDSNDPYEPGTTPVEFYNGRVDTGFQTEDSYSRYGAYDMTGNVWEWCSDLRTDLTPNQAPVKGGSYLDPAGSQNITLDSAEWLPITERRENIGFRCMKEK